MLLQLGFDYDYVAHVKITANLWHEELIKRDFYFFYINYILL